MDDGRTTLTGKHLDMQAEEMVDWYLITDRDDNQWIEIDGQQYSADDTLPVNFRDRTARELVERMGKYLAIDPHQNFSQDDDPDADVINRLVAQFLAVQP